MVGSPRKDKLHHAPHLAPEPRRSLTVDLYDRYLCDRGQVLNMFRTMAHRTATFETIIAHMEAVLKTGTLSTALKALVIVRTSQLNRMPCCLASHTTIARRRGWTDAQLTATAPGYTEQDFARSRSFYTEAKAFELMAAISLFNYFNPFNDLLQMEPTQFRITEELAIVASA